MADSVIQEIVLTEEQRRQLLECLDQRLEGDLSVWKTAWMDMVAELARIWNRISPTLKKYYAEISALVAAGGTLAAKFRDALRKWLLELLRRAAATTFAQDLGLALVDAILIELTVVALSILMDVFVSCALALIPDSI